MAAASAWCRRASEPRCAASVPAAEPIRAPALHMPCSPDMIDLSSSRSTSTPSAFIATSAMPAVAPYDEHRQAQRQHVRRERRQDQGQRPQAR